MRSRSLVVLAATSLTLGAVLSAAGPAQAVTTSTSATSSAGAYHSVSQNRILDTRYGLGAPMAKAGPDSTTTVTVLGAGGIPTTGVAAVVFNFTAVTPSAGTFLTAYPAGIARPQASNLNLDAGMVRANQVTIPVGAGGAVSLYNAFGSVDLLADVLGYYDTTGTSGGLIPIGPDRIFDSRTEQDGPALGPDETVSAGLSLGNPTADPHITALAINITAIGPQAGGYLSTWDGSVVKSTTSTVNFSANDNVPNAAIVPVAHITDAQGNLVSYFMFQNVSAGSTHVAIDVVGFYTDGQVKGDLRYAPFTPTRVLDTRFGVGGLSRFGEGETKQASVPSSLRTDQTYGFSGNVTAVTPTASTYLTVYPTSTSPRPDTSTVNTNPGQTVANAALVNASYNIFNAVGSTDVLVDVSGRFDFYPGPAASASTSSPGAGFGSRPATRMPSSRH